MGFLADVDVVVFFCVRQKVSAYRRRRNVAFHSRRRRRQSRPSPSKLMSLKSWPLLLLIRQSIAEAKKHTKNGSITNIRFRWVSGFRASGFLCSVLYFFLRPVFVRFFVDVKWSQVIHSRVLCQTTQQKWKKSMTSLFSDWKVPNVSGLESPPNNQIGCLTIALQNMKTNLLPRASGRNSFQAI